MKKCGACKKYKLLTEFHNAKREKDGKQSRCKQCDRKTGASYRLKNKKKEKLRHAKYHADHKEKINQRISKWQKENKVKCRQRSKRFYENNREKESARKKNIYWKDPQKRLAIVRQWRQNNIEHRRHYDAQYFQNNKSRVYAKNARRRALKRQAIPPWANYEKIQSIYDECARLSADTGIQHHVDHVIPLTSKFVCGLHCESNLQILTKSENSQKSNKFSPYSF